VALLCPEAQAMMAELRCSPAGRPMDHDLRAMLDAIGYVTRYGIEWRVGFQKSVTFAEQQLYATRSYSLIKPPRMVRRLIRVAAGRTDHAGQSRGRLLEPHRPTELPSITASSRAQSVSPVHG